MFLSSICFQHQQIDNIQPKTKTLHLSQKKGLVAAIFSFYLLLKSNSNLFEGFGRSPQKKSFITLKNFFTTPKELIVAILRLDCDLSTKRQKYSGYVIRKKYVAVIYPIMIMTPVTWVLKKSRLQYVAVDFVKW